MGKCEFWKVCNSYMPKSITCDKDDGDYYGYGKKAGCYRSLKEFGEGSNFFKKDAVAEVS